MTSVSGKLNPLHRVIADMVVQTPGARRLSKAIRESRLTFVSRKKLRRLGTAIYIASLSKDAGIYLEAGVALGGTAIFIAKRMPRNSELRLYDVFGMIPPPSEHDDADAISRYEVIASGQSKGIDGDPYYGYMNDLKSIVAENLRRFGVDPSTGVVTLVEGKFEDTLDLEVPVRFAHVDCDWYDSVVTCIDRIWPKLVNGGVMLFDDYRSYVGCQKAVDEFIAKTPNCEVLFSDVSLAVRKLA